MNEEERERMGKDKYFRGKRCNTDWIALESDSARELRGHGWYNFRRMLIRERGNRCQVCGHDAGDNLSYLNGHHVIKIRKARHLRFERDNVLLVCPTCHWEAEKHGSNLNLPELRELAELLQVRDGGQVTDASGL